VSAATAPSPRPVANHLPWPEPPATGAPTGGGLDLPAQKRPPRVVAATRPVPSIKQEESLS
jgi:hypothetical protein